MTDPTPPERAPAASPRTEAPAGRPELIDALAPAVDRGHHLALLAAEGAGKSLLYAAAAAATLEPGGEAVGGLILTATPERARRCASIVHVALSGSGLGILAWPPLRGATPDPTPPPAPGPALLAGRPEAILAEVRRGGIGLGSLRLLIIDDVAALDDAWSAVEAILAVCESGTRKIVASHLRTARFDELLRHQLPRARRWPPELFDEAERAHAASPAAGRGPAAVIRCGSAASEGERLRLLAAAVRESAEPEAPRAVAVFCTDPRDPETVAAALAADGFALASGPGAPGVRVGALEPAERGEPAAEGEAPAGGVSAGEAPETRLLYGLPTSLAAFRAALEGGGPRAAIVPTLHRTQLELLAARLGWRVAPLGSGLGREPLDEIETFRARVLAELEGGDLAPSLLLLEPVIAEHGADRVAAALAALLRRADRGPLRQLAETGEAERASRPAWTRLYVSVGKRDGAGPGDLVGAITGETGAAGAQIGRVDMRASHSLVDIDSMIADDVVRKLHGARIKGRTVTARVDRDR